MIAVSEIFYSIQGEGVLQGLPTVFVRLQGCNLLTYCSYCDTRYALGVNTHYLMTTEEVVKKCVDLQTRVYRSWVCITGGEPLFQSEALHELVKGLRSLGFQVSVETNGSVKKPYWWTLVNSWVFDIKCPSSGVCGTSLEDWFETRVHDQAKFVVGTKEDLDFARQVIMRNMVRSPIVLVSPVSATPPVPNDAWDGKELYESYTHWQEDWLQEVAEFCKEMKVRFSLQVHRVVYGLQRGV